MSRCLSAQLLAQNFSLQSFLHADARTIRCARLHADTTHRRSGHTATDAHRPTLAPRRSLKPDELQLAVAEEAGGLGAEARAEADVQRPIPQADRGNRFQPLTSRVIMQLEVVD